MAHVMQPNLRLMLFFVYLVIESFKKILMRHLAMGSFIVYLTNIISNTMIKIADCMELKVVKS